jgi:hypothetical protein
MSKEIEQVFHLEHGKHVEFDPPHSVSGSTHEVLETPKFRENAQNITQKYQNFEKISRIDWLHIFYKSSIHTC